MAVDKLGAGGTRIIKVTADYLPDVNVPGVLMPYVADWLDLADPDEKKAVVCITKNGIAQVSGIAAGAGIDVYPGTDPANGDLKFTAGLATNDVLTISYHTTRYATV